MTALLITSILSDDGLIKVFVTGSNPAGYDTGQSRGPVSEILAMCSLSPPIRAQRARSCGCGASVAMTKVARVLQMIRHSRTALQVSDVI